MHKKEPQIKSGVPKKSILYNYLFENFFNVLSAVFVAFLGRVAVYLLRTVESSGLLYAAGGNILFNFIAF